MISAGNKIRLVLLVPLFLCFAFGSEKIAIVTKIVGKAEYVRKKEPPKGLKRGFLIESGDEILTKRDAFVALVFALFVFAFLPVALAIAAALVTC